MAFLRLCGYLTIHPDYRPMNQYLGGFKSGINFALEPEWVYIRVSLYPGGPLFVILR